MRHPRRTFSIGAIVAACTIALIVQSTISANADVAPSASNGSVGSGTVVSVGTKAASAAPSSAVSIADLTSDLFTPEEVEELNREWDAAQQAAGAVQPQVIPAVIVGALTICAGTAVVSVGQQVIENLIAEGKSGTAKQLIAKAISGCVFGVATVGVGAACRVFPPCRKAVQTAIEKAAQRIVDRLRRS
jgi:hypothetical protein